MSANSVSHADMQGPGPDQSRQYISALAILFVAIFIGLPIWWKTTEVYRCPLPYKEISELAHQQVPPQIVFQVSLALVGEGERQLLEKLVTQVQQELHGNTTTVVSGNTQVKVRFDVKLLSLDPQTRSELTNVFQSSSESLEEFSVGVSALLPPSSLGHYTVLIVPQLKSRGAGGEESRTFVSQYRHAVVQTGPEVSTAAPLVADVVRAVYGDVELMGRMLRSVTGKQQDRIDSESMRQLRATHGYQISFTLINPDPSQTQVSWNIEETTQSILLPFLSHTGIANLGNFTVNSQVFFYTDVKFRPHKASDSDGYYVLSSELPPMISSVESKLGSLVSQLPSLNFVIYLPKRTEYPLHIQQDQRSKVTPTNAFLVPQWGGVVVYNPPEMGSGQDMELQREPVPQNKLNVSVRMEELMPLIIGQLKMLLGVPVHVPQRETFSFAPGEHGITDWQTDQLLISKMVESVSMATTSLISLVQLLDKVKNMVISDHIQQEVESALESIQKCYRSAAEGDLQEAYSSAKSAMFSAETAFFDPSILELLYFPDDQKFAIYIPLFLPISVPILLSSLAAIRWGVTTLRTRTADKQKRE